MVTVIDEVSPPRMRNAVRKLRQARGWRSEDLAARSGVSHALVRRLEQEGRDHNPTAETMLRLAQAFGLPLCEVFWPDDEHAA